MGKEGRQAGRQAGNRALDVVQVSHKKSGDIIAPVEEMHGDVLAGSACRVTFGIQSKLSPLLSFYLSDENASHGTLLDTGSTIPIPRQYHRCVHLITRSYLLSISLASSYTFACLLFLTPLIFLSIVQHRCLTKNQHFIHASRQQQKIESKNINLRCIEALNQDEKSHQADNR